MSTESNPIVIKFGGSRFTVDGLAPFAQSIARLVHQGRRVVIVHGGGKDISSLLERFGMPAQFVDGLRVTDEATLDATELVLSGRVNKRITRALQREGIPAVGVAGTDAALIQAVVHSPVKQASGGQLLKVDLGRVGAIQRVDTRLLDVLWSAGFVPVVSPLGLAPDGDALNINADTAAAAIAGTLAAELRLLTDVPGILRSPAPTPLSSASPTAIEAMKREGIIRGGMIPKVDACLEAVALGAPFATIQSLDVFLANQDLGTRIAPE